MAASQSSDQLQILAQTEHWVAVEKPEAWLSVDSRDGAKDPRPCLARAVEQKLGGRIFPVHRLDFEVSGVMLFARTPEFQRALSSAWEAHQVQKTYHARVRGDEAKIAEWGESWTWTSLLVRGKRRSFVADHGKPAETRGRMLERIGGEALVELVPITGRPHQLRVECARHGAAILGDELYGGTRADWAGLGIALRAVRLKLPNELCEKWGLAEEIPAPTDPRVKL